MSTPQPPRPLGPEGLRLWGRWYRRVTDREHLLAVCEHVDERMFLRTRVLRGEATPSDRDGLRKLDDVILDGIERLGREAAWKAYAR